MNYFDSTKQKKNLSLNDYKDKLEIEQEIYQRFLREQSNIRKDETYIDMVHLENIFTNEIYYQAMKNIPVSEKQVLYLYFYERKTLNEICQILKKSKKEIVNMKRLAIQHFKENLKKLYSKKIGGVVDE